MKCSTCKIILLFTAWTSSTSAADVRIEPVDPVNAMFGNQAVEYSFRVTFARPDDTLFWSHSAEQRTLQRGETRVSNANTATVRLTFPKIRDGVIQRTTLAVKTSERQFQFPLWLFPEDPFIGRTAELKELNLQLLDHSGTTANILDRFGIPHRRLRAIKSAQLGGVLIVGENVPITSTVTRQLFEHCASGGTVIALASADIVIPTTSSSLTMPGLGGGPDLLLASGRNLFAKPQQGDGGFWKSGPVTNLPSTRLSLASRRGHVELRANETSGEWPWMEVQFPQVKGSQGRNGRFLYCGFRIIEQIDNGPVPRFFLHRLLQSLPIQPSTVLNGE